jgi:hypothetical protein
MQREQFLRLAGLALGGVALAPVLTACGGGGELATDVSTPVREGAASLSVTTDDLSADEIAGLLFMREEEKLAHDVYVALDARWGALVFNNIVPSEAQHTEAVRQLILSHGLPDPAATTPPGVFVNSDLQQLYDALVALGQPSLIDALKVGCLIEEKDIIDIEEKKQQVLDEPDIVRVYDNLLCGSRNHLRAFNQALVAAGGAYDQPQFLTLAEWTAIAESAQERCGN